MNIQNLLFTLELNKEKEDLQALGLTDEEIDGYMDFYLDNWLNKSVPQDN